MATTPEQPASTFVGQVEVTLGWCDDIEESEERATSWYVTIKIIGQGWDATFVVEEPYLITREKWMAFLDGQAHKLSFYQGNGEGSIKSESGFIVFRAMPSGAGGDVVQKLRVPFQAVAPKIRDALQTLPADCWPEHE
jgi:hypothetical protein